MHIMIDLETMGTRPNAPIIAIGAVAFDAGGIGTHSFYKNVDMQSAVTAGATIDPSTVMWWMQQSDEARAALLAGDPVDIVTALDAFGSWVGAVCGGSDLVGLMLDGMWGNGASFDNMLMSESYKRLGLNPPWPFWKDRCYRTVKSMFPKVPMARSGTHHNALDDAITQAKHLIEISKAHGNFL
jgi:exodeoxyribonuclease VIII